MIQFTKYMAVCLLALLAACGGDGGIDYGVGNGNGVKLVTTTYAGLGSYWTVSKTYADDLSRSGDFTLTRANSRAEKRDGTVTGEWQILESGFMEFEVTGGTGLFVDVPEGFTFHGLEIPKTLLILKMPDRDQILYMPVVGGCPTEVLTVNGIWMHTGGTLDWDAHEVIHAEATIDPQAQTVQSTGYFFNEGLNQHRLRDRAAAIHCDAGELTVEGNDVTQDGILTASGVGAIGGAMLVPQDGGIGVADLGGTYVGVVYGPGDADRDREVKALTATIAADGTEGTVQIVRGPDALVVESEYPLSISVPVAGAVPGSFLYSTSGDFGITDRGLGVMLAVRDLGGSGQTFIVAHGQRPADNRPYFMFLVQNIGDGTTTQAAPGAYCSQSHCPTIQARPPKL